MTQTFAIIIDAYRELNAKRLFWFTLAISGLVVLVFAMLGNNEKGLTVLSWTIEVPFLSTQFIPRSEFYKLFFVNLGLGVWLTWIAMILAIISTASIFPDFLAGGAVELTLSKPIGRLRLFMTKYIAALLFVGLQVLVFAGASFLVIGLRGGEWIPAVFLSVPLVVLVFSYLFSISVLIGTLWRSTIAALMLTLAAWALIAMVNAAEIPLLMVKIGMEERLQKQAERIEVVRQSIRNPESGDAAPATGTAPARERPTEGGLLAGLKWALEQGAQAESVPDIERQRLRLERMEQRLEEMRTTRRKFGVWYSVVWGIKTVLPKTAETTKLMERYIIDLAKLDKLRNEAEPQQSIDLGGQGGDDDPRVDEREVGRKLQQTLMTRKESWIIGTSLAFEAVMIGVAAWVFCRRDF